MSCYPQRYPLREDSAMITELDEPAQDVLGTAEPMITAIDYSKDFITP
jgi:hypothetical protein